MISLHEVGRLPRPPSPAQLQGRTYQLTTASLILKNGFVVDVERGASSVASVAISGEHFCDYDQALPFPPAHVDALDEAVERFGLYPLRPPE